MCVWARGGTWLRHCATSWKVAGSTPDGVIRIFNWHNPSVCTIALWLTQPPTEMSTRNISGGWRRLVRRADNLTIFMCWLSWNLGASPSWNPRGLSSPVMGMLYLMYIRISIDFRLSSVVVRGFLLCFVYYIWCGMVSFFIFLLWMYDLIICITKKADDFKQGAS